MHMRNLNEKLSLHDVVNFHEIIAEKKLTGVSTLLGFKEAQ